MKNTLLLESITGEEISANLKPLDNIRGYEVRPGFYEVNGASALPAGLISLLLLTTPHPVSLCFSTENPSGRSSVFLFRNTIGSGMSFP